ncbi:hypothetical protein [Mycobacterium syngnathidarum]
MTDSSREQHIAQALSQYNGQQGTKDTLRVPLRGGMLLEVIEIPLELPVLNPDSFRIAPALAEHPQADVVKADPYSPEAQHIVTDLVRKAHRQADALKDSLIDGQDQPGVITRKGKLVNANSRCVLLRELRTEGRIATSTLRVAVLPSDVTEPEELELESILQKQREHKDEYNLVSELMMLKKLHEGAGLSDAAIAKRLRTRPSRIGDLRDALDLMERARRLTNPPMPLSAFITERDQRQNWLELLGNVREIDARDGRPAGDLAIQRWMIAYVLGFNSVHKLRHAAGAWIETEVLPDLADGDDIASAIADNAAIPPEAPAQSNAHQPPGLDILGDEPAPPPEADAVAVQNLLNLSVAAAEAGEADIELADGTVVPAADVKDVLVGSINRGLEARKRKSLAGSKLQRPVYGLTQARTGLREALEGLDEVGDRPGFQPFREDVLILVDEVRDLIEEIADALHEAEIDSGSDD